MATSVSVGDKVTTTAEYDVYGTHLCSFVRTTTYDVIQVGGTNLSPRRIVIGLGSAVTAAVDIGTLTVVSSKNKTPAKPAKKTPTVPPKPPEVIDNSKLSDTIYDNLGDTSFKNNYTDKSGGSSAFVQESGGRKKSTEYNDKNYNDEHNVPLASKPMNGSPSLNIRLSQSYPEFVVNDKMFPPKHYNIRKGYEYDYYIDYDAFHVLYRESTNSNMNLVRRSVNDDIETRHSLYTKYQNRYNKFKLAYTDDVLSKSFAHVFFIRPDCNIFESVHKLNQPVANLSEFYYASKHCPEMLRQLTQKFGGYGHEFMLYPSNKVRSFQIADEYIVSDTYGQALTGYKIPYGKDNVESRTAGKFSINYIDDRDLHLYNMHKLWIDYISYVYRGKLKPLDEYNVNKILDYATCVYYILCAEDGETVIFWSKYWGVFPLEAPSSSFSYTAENPGGIRMPELSIEYQYAWKEDFNPLSLVEFNEHSCSELNYIDNYQNSKIGTGYSWAGVPFIETFNSNSLEIPYTFKLRFRPPGQSAKGYTLAQQ